MRHNIDPLLWGKHFWKTIYYSIDGLNEQLTQEDKNNFTQFMDSLKHLLPCEKCRINVTHKNIPEIIQQAETKTQLTQAILNIEN
jgi:hypothetical protein